MKLVEAGKFRTLAQVVALVTLTAFINATWETTRAWAQYTVPSDTSGAAVGTYSADSMSALSSFLTQSSQSATPAASDESEPSEEAAAGGVQLPKGGDAIPAGSISLPSGPSTVLGMGESFAPQLSTGVATLTVPINLPAARGGVQPRLDLSYSSAGGFGLAGKGWSIGTSAISRQTDRGLPKYIDLAEWRPEQDRFIFGGAELVPICTVNGSSCPGLLAGEVMPVWTDGWQYFRAHIEGSFLRFFWSPDHRTWRVQTRDGANLELGFPLDGSNYQGALEANPDRPDEIYRWHAVRQYDANGEVNASSNPMPVNQVVYRHMTDGNSVYLTDIYDTSPAANPTTLDLSQYAHHTSIAYERRPDPVVSYRQGWKTAYALRVSHIDISSKPFSGSVTQRREMVRRYHLEYDSTAHDSLLLSLQVEGRCGFPVTENENELLGATSCPRQPKMSFEYQRVESEAPALLDDEGYAYEPFDTTVRHLPSSPPHSLDESDTALMDVNADGLPDVVVTAPGFYGGNHGLFLNGYGGENAGIGFSVSQEMAVQKLGVVDSGVLTLSNPNVTALDLDADGLINLVHITGGRSYSIFTPKYFEDTGWQWTGVSQGTASGQDIKIDFTRDTRDIQVMDVNADGLVDVVYSSPTEMQTFFSLGRYPGGDGQFGHAERTGAATAEISNEPMTACSPWSARPARFSDPDIRVAEMNGDGLPDIVRVRSGQIIYWPGRGNGFWGTGPRDDCPAGHFADERHITMDGAPHYGTADTLLLSDVNGDGLSDMVEVRANEVDIYLNDNGTGWTDRLIIENTPFKTSGTNYVRLSDIDGSGTPDILWGRAFEYKFIDLTGGVRPHILTRMDNGLGKSVEFQYATSTQLMLEAEAEGNPWSERSPIVVPVVVSSTARDNLERIGRPAGVYETEYQYRDPIYDGRTRQFRGFREAVVSMPGDSNYPTAHTRSVFLMGECPTDDNGTALDVCSEPERWKDNWREALTGLPVISESFDDSGRYLTTVHTGYELRQLYTGQDGRRVIVPFPTAKNVFSYDTANFQAVSSPIELDEVAVELWDREPYTETRQVVRQAVQGTSRIRSRTVYDDFGNITQSIQQGCVEGCPAGVDETVIGHSDFGLPPGDGSGWMWREQRAYITGSIHTEHRNEVAHEFDRFGRVTKSKALLWGTLPLDRFHESGATIAPSPTAASGGINEAVEVTTVEHTYDQFGHALFSRGANNRCSGGEVDPLYASLPVLSRSFAGDVGANGCGEREFTQQATYDRGLQKVLTSINATGQPSRFDYDGFGRLVAITSVDPDNPGVLAAYPQKTFEYALPTDALHPYSKVRTSVQDGPNVNTWSYRDSWRFVDGLGRTISALSEADPSAGDEGAWVAAGEVLYNRRNTPAVIYEPRFTNMAPEQYLLNPPLCPNSADLGCDFTTARYDAFGRQVDTYKHDGTLVLHTDYHALSTDYYDAGDSGSGVHSGTYATHISDGFGRGAKQIERIRVNGQLEERILINAYLPTGEVERVVQQKAGSADVVRWMRYDSQGRMVLNVEPNT
ncbi:MAG: hypothetical protein JXA30_04985, partial [Deltaproteobacteria bacterium]|nr:hypothetical protein [Deltaproteobacteria bacterium]